MGVGPREPLICATNEAGVSRNTIGSYFEAEHLPPSKFDNSYFASYSGTIVGVRVDPNEARNQVTLFTSIPHVTLKRSNRQGGKWEIAIKTDGEEEKFFPVNLYLEEKK